MLWFGANREDINETEAEYYVFSALRERGTINPSISKMLAQVTESV